ncbi:MAG: hypothetical protein ACTSWY_16145, partial [Promethearchaeota archaeon]
SYHRIRKSSYNCNSKVFIRTPYCPSKKYSFLAPTPQSIIALHRATGSPILPVLSFPDGVIRRSRIKFLDNRSIMEVSRKNWESPEKVFHGIISIELNNTLHPYILKFIHCWEQLVRFGISIRKNHLEFPPVCSCREFLKRIQLKIKEILEGSFEPHRNDKQILQTINEHFPKILNELKNPGDILRQNKTNIDLALMDGKSKIVKLCMVGVKELKMKNEFRASVLLKEMAKKIII